MGVHIIKCGRPVVPLRVEDTVLLEDFGDDWNGGIDRVRNHKHEGLGAGQGDPGSEIADDTGVDLTSKQVNVSVNTGEMNGQTLNKSSLKSW